MRSSAGVALFILVSLFTLDPSAWAQQRPSAQSAWRDCAGRNIQTAIRSCTAIVERKGAKSGTLARAYLYRGKAHKTRGEWRKAIADFDEAIHYQPRNAGAYRERGDVYWRAGNRPQAQADFDRSIRLKPDAVTLSLRGWFFKDHDEGQANADFDQAIALADKAIRVRTNLAEAHHARAEALAGKANYERAISDFGQAIRLKPNDDEAYLNRGITYWLKGDENRALADMSEAVRIQPDSSSAYYWRGLLQLEKAPDLALPDFDRVIALSPENAAGFHGRGALYRTKGDFDRALPDVNEALRLNPEFADAYSNRGWIYIAKKEFDRAILDFSRAININPKLIGARDGRGLAYFMLNDYPKSLADYDAVITFAPSASAFRRRGDVHQLAANKEAALADFNEAVRLMPDDPESYRARASAYDWFQEEERALADYNTVVRLRPNDAKSYQLRAKHYIGARKLDLALADAEKALRIEPTNEFYLLRSTVHVEMKNYDQALAAAGEALRLAPNAFDVLEARSKIFVAKGEPDRAVAELNTLVEAHPDNASAYAQRAHYFTLQLKKDPAIADYTEAIRLEPSRAFHYSQRGMVYLMKGDTSRALADFDRATKLDPTIEMRSSGRTQAYSDLGDLDRALAAAEEGVRRNPHNTDSFNQRGAVYLKKKDFAKALQDFEEAIRLDPNGLGANLAYKYRADLFTQQENYGRALQDYGTVLERYQDDWGAYVGRANTRLLAGDIEGAISDADTAVRVFQNSLSYSVRGVIKAQLGRWDAALEDFDEALRLEPLDDTVFANRARALLGLGRPEEALTIIELSLRMSVDRAFPLTIRGTIYLALDRNAEAVDDFSTSIRLGRNDRASTYVWRAAAYKKLGMHAEALADYRKATGLNVTSLWDREARVAAREKAAELEAAGPQATGALPREEDAKPVDLGRRIALVIGVAAYQHIPILANPRNDAKAMSDAFRRLGFAEVTELLDPSRAKLEEAIKGFGDQAANADWAVVFFAGHGVAIDGQNFLIPADAKIDRASHVEYETLSLDRVMNSASEAKKLGLVILDACRDNPFLQRMQKDGRVTRSLGTGLARVEPKRGELVAFATRDGHVAADGTGHNSPFTEGMLEHIEEANLDIRFFFDKVRDTVLVKTRDTQMPFTYGSLPGQGFFFKSSTQ